MHYKMLTTSAPNLWQATQHPPPPMHVPIGHPQHPPNSVALASWAVGPVEDPAGGRAGKEESEAIEERMFFWGEAFGEACFW